MPATRKLRCYRDDDGYMVVVAYDEHSAEGRAAAREMAEDVVGIRPVSLAELSEDERRRAIAERFHLEFAYTYLFDNPDIGEPDGP